MSYGILYSCKLLQSLLNIIEKVFANYIFPQYFHLNLYTDSNNMLYFCVIRMNYVIPRRAIFKIWCSNNNEELFDWLYNFNLGKYGDFTLQEKLVTKMKDLLRSLCQQNDLIRQNFYRNRWRFKQNNNDWLEQNIVFYEVSIRSCDIKISPTFSFDA